jgi:hypothetical protein
MRLTSILLLAACARPTAGTYGITITNTETSCPANYFPLAAPGESVEIEVKASVPEVVLLLIPEEHCPLDGFAFSCPFSGQDDSVDHNADGIDAIYTTEAGISGEWSNSAELTAVTSLSNVCDGAGCEELAEEEGMPDCTVAWYWTGKLLAE